MGNTSIIKIQEDLNKIKRQLCCIRTDIDNVEIYNSRVSFSTYSGNFDTEIALGADDISFPVNPHEDDTIVIHFTDVVGYYTYTGTEWALNWSTDIANVPVEFSQIQNIATNKLLGRSTAGSGVIEELTIGTGLSLSGGTLSNTATASPPAGSDGYIQYNNSGAFGASSNLFWDKTNNRLGIGTSSPTSTLTISGSISTVSAVNNEGFIINGGPKFISTGGANGSLVFQGIGTFDSNGFLIRNSAGSVNYININYGSPGNILFPTGNVNIGSTTDLSARLGIKGSGSTSATTSLLVRNSSAYNTFKVQDNGTTTVTGNSDRVDIFVVGNPANSIGLGSNTANNPVLRLGLMNFSVHPSGNSWSFNNQSNSFTLYNNGSAGKGPFILCGNVDGTADGHAFILQSLARQNGTKHNPTSGILNIVTIEPNLSTYTEFNPTSGNATYNILNVEQYINTTGSYSGIVRGIYYNPTVVSKIGATHNAIETTAGNIIFNNGNVGIGTSSPSVSLESTGTIKGIHVVATSNIDFGNILYGTKFWSQNDGKTFIGDQSVPSAMLQVKGSGSTSATTSLLVQNSSGTEAFRIKDNQDAIFSGTVTLKGYTVATLPAGTVGMNAYVTDALAPTYLTTVVGGGAVNCPVFFDGTNWVAH